MQKLHIAQIFLLAVLTILLNSCEVVEAIFKTGMGIGIFITVTVVVVILVLIGIIRGRKK